MGLQVGLPCVLDSRFERDDQDTSSSETFGELIGRKGLAEAHLRIPQEPWHHAWVLAPDRLIVILSPLDGEGLLGSHRERLEVRAGKLYSGAQLDDRRPNVIRSAAHPLSC